MPNYNLGKPSDLRRWARDTAKDMERELNRELRRRPARLPVEVQDSAVTRFSGWQQGAGPMTFNISGDGNQLAVGNAGKVQQSIVLGLPPADLVELIRQLRAAAAELGLDDEDRADFESAVTAMEEEVAKSDPRKGRFRRSLAAISDFLRHSGTDVAASLAPLVTAVLQSMQATD